MKKTKTPQTPQLQEPDTQSKRRLSLPKVAYSAFLCVMMSMMFCQPPVYPYTIGSVTSACFCVQ